jgi:carbamoyl-phosphate synthase large subunit
VRIDGFLEGLEVDVDAVTDGTDVLIPGLMEHVEAAGVHSGDSVATFPPQRLSGTDQGLIVDAMRRVCLEIGVRGLVNAQFIVRDDGVYLLEVNPRASRTVPFLSKVTRVPMVAIATKVGAGASLAELGWKDGLLPPPPVVAVKAPVFSTAKLRGVDPTLGPGMQSTGEVIGLHQDADVALAKALLAASLRPPVPDAEGALALVTVADRDKHRLGQLATALATAGYRFAATAGTAAALRALGHETLEVSPLGEVDEARPAILDVIAAGDVSLVVNTPTPRSGALEDAAAVRHAAVAEGILCMTTMDTAIAAARSLDPDVQARVGDVRSLDAWLDLGPGAAEADAAKS